MKKVLISILCFIPLLALLVATNFLVDPGNIRGAGAVVDSIIEIISSGRNADGVSDFRDRTFMKRYVPTFEAAPETLVLGSSRGAQIDSAMLGDGLFNSCVTGATIEDVVSIYEIYEQNGLVPKRVALAVDPWFFDANKNDVRYLNYLSEYYEAFVQKHVDESFSVPAGASLSDYKSFLSVSYFQSSIAALKSGNASVKSPKITASDSDFTYVGMLKRDGSYVYPVSYSEANKSEIDGRVDMALSGILSSLADCGGMDSFKTSLFEALADSILDGGSELVIILSPYHPRVYGLLAEAGSDDILEEIEAYMADFCKERGITLVGSYDPGKLGYGEDVFMDALHISRMQTAELVAGIFDSDC